MEQISSRSPSRSQVSEVRPSSPSMLAYRAPPVLPSPREMMGDNRLAKAPPTIPQPRPSPAERIELPSIRQHFPEIQLRDAQGEADFNKTESRQTSPRMGIKALLSPSEYSPPQSLHKRRKISSDDDHELERSPPRFPALQDPGLDRRASSVSMPESVSYILHNSPYPQRQKSPTVRNPPPFDSPLTTRSEWDRTLPSLSSTFQFDGPSPQGSRRSSKWSEYSLDYSRTGSQTHTQPTVSAFNPPSTPYQPPLFSYGYHSRHQSYSGPSTAPSVKHDRTPFSSNLHASSFPNSNFSYGHDGNELGGTDKQRKRRGNLPKETTDKLRAWFMSHLTHPYPTEDEKQDLMRHTGLAMNQISNWFINARRRQLPTIVNNARVESNARSAGGGDGILSNFGVKSESTLIADSDGDYEEDYDRSGTPRTTNALKEIKT